MKTTTKRVLFSTVLTLFLGFVAVSVIHKRYSVLAPVLVQIKTTGACVSCSLENFDLQHLDLSGVDFRGANLQGANLEATNLSEANLSGTILIEANLHKA
ncbi:MAG: pentapeptide repeat-containing protein [Anaerolineales bacterium]|nr:pentapeptide repeat-containing protein [Anaerolineales bacterium]